VRVNLFALRCQRFTPEVRPNADAFQVILRDNDVGDGAKISDRHSKAMQDQG
jgi:hypothetical protein